MFFPATLRGLQTKINFEATKLKNLTCNLSIRLFGIVKHHTSFKKNFSMNKNFLSNLRAKYAAYKLALFSCIYDLSLRKKKIHIETKSLKL